VVEVRSLNASGGGLTRFGPDAVSRCVAGRSPCNSRPAVSMLHAQVKPKSARLHFGEALCHHGHRHS
jgi:hypothetical protein